MVPPSDTLRNLACTLFGRVFSTIQGKRPGTYASGGHAIKTATVFTAALAGEAVASAAGLVAFTATTARRIERSFPARGRFVDIDGARVHYHEEGNGPVLLFIHGLGGQMGNFTHSLVAHLTNAFRVIVIERAGSGHSSRPRGMAAGPLAQAALIAKFIDALGLERPTLVGHSLGGAIALAAALEFPDRVGALVLIAPLTHPQDAVPDPFKTLAIASPWARRLFAWTLATPSTIAQRRTVLDALFGPDAPPHDFATKGGGLLSLRPKSFIAASMDLVAATRDLRAMTGRYCTLALPIAILFGSGDRVLDHRAQGERMRALVPHSRFETVSGGHMLPVSDPERTAAFIRANAAVPSDPASTSTRGRSA